VLLNLVLIGLTMLPAFHRVILPKFSSRIEKPYYALAAVHGGLGSVAELGGLYILVAAGTDLLPREAPHQALQILDEICPRGLVDCSFARNDHLYAVVCDPAMKG